MMNEHLVVLIEFVASGALFGVAFLSASAVVMLGTMIAGAIKTLFVKLRRAIRFERAKKHLEEAMKERQDIHVL